MSPGPNLNATEVRERQAEWEEGRNLLPNLTATELLMQREEWERKQGARYKAACERVITPYINRMFHLLGGREVCKKRARCLKRRGESVAYASLTTTGKSRWVWVKTLRVAIR